MCRAKVAKAAKVQGIKVRKFGAVRMSITATLVLIDGEDENKRENLGDFEFVAVPSTGDLIPMSNAGGTPYVYQVVSMLHFPVSAENSHGEGGHPQITILVDLVGLDTISSMDLVNT